MKKLVFLLMLAAVFSTGCASIVRGPSQAVGISSSPMNAEYTVGDKQGKTPAVVRLKRADNHVVVVEKNGYEPASVPLVSEFDALPLIGGNLISWGPLGMVVDYATGSSRHLEPGSVNVTLVPLGGERSSTGTTERIVITPIDTSRDVGLIGGAQIGAYTLDSTALGLGVLGGLRLSTNLSLDASLSYYDGIDVEIDFGYDKEAINTSLIATEIGVSYGLTQGGNITPTLGAGVGYYSTRSAFMVNGFGFYAKAGLRMPLTQSLLAIADLKFVNCSAERDGHEGDLGGTGIIVGVVYSP